MAETIAFKLVNLKHNQGLGNALRVALENCKFELVARMDSDDISQPYRFEKQLDYFRSNPSVDMVGGNITEFVGNEDNITGQRYVPESDAEIKRYMKKRCAFNHMSVMYKKAAVVKAGGYRDWFWNEDYYLWIRMMLSGASFANVQDNIVNVRVGDEMSSRRGGIRYFKSEAGLQKFMLDNQIITYGQYLYNNAIRFAGEVLAPNWLRAKLFRFTRKKVDIVAGEPCKTNVHSDTLTDVEEAEPDNLAQRKSADKHPISQSEYPPFSVAMSVYSKDNPKWFDRALESLMNQTVKPTEIVLVVDGPIPESIQIIIDKYTAICARGGVLLRACRLKKNQGLGNALRVAVDQCQNEWIARMDSDDVSISDRFEQQLRYIISNPGIDIIGGDITEFVGEESNIVGKREVPQSDAAIKNYMKTRCAMNHVSVMYKKEVVQAAGGYLDWFWNEDYYLWIRMLESGCMFANTGTVLVNVRSGMDMYSRRGGKKYFKSELRLQNYMLKKQIIGIPTYLMNTAKRVIVQLLLPNKIRGWVFRTLARERN